jgi:predicted chitinase
MTGTIIGNQNPLVGTTYTYEIKPSGLSFGLKGDYEWYLYKKQKNGSWKDITNQPKKGEKVTYRFGEIGLGIEFQMKVYEIKKGILPGMSATKELAGSCILIPTSDKVSKIEKVILFNRGAKDVNKASYRDTLIAQAHCIAMFNREIEFHLWEDDAPGKGHDANINKNNRHTRSYKARVNEKGIAEVSIPLMSDEKILRQMANQFLMKGDRNEGANHEYYVTATYSGQIQGASQVNVDVANPDYKGQPQNQPQPKPQPDKHTPKFPAGQGGGPKQPDPKGNIIEAVFIDDKGNELSKVAVGDKVRVRIHSKNMVGKHIQYVIWEYDTTSNDEVYRSGNIKIPADVCDTSGFVITKDIFGKGIDSPIGDPDSDAQNYFIEIISKDLSAESQKFGVNSEGLMQVEKVKSAAGVQKQPEPEVPKTGKCFCNRDFTPEEFEKIIHGLRDSEKRVKQSSGYNLFNAPNCNIKTEDRTIEKLRSQINNIFNKYGINTCLRKLHFLSQIYHETDRLRTAKEYADGIKYDPGKHPDAITSGNTTIGDGEKYKGRGLMQLTWKNNYKIYKYYSGIDVVTNYQKVSDILTVACESAGWYWKQGKILSVGTRWKGPADAPSYVKTLKPDYPKDTIIWEDNGKKKKYGTVNMGLIADDDKVDLISYLVNGGANGLQERRNYVITLKSLFEYPQKCVNKTPVSQPVNNGSASSVTIRLVRKWQTKKSTIGEFTIDNTQIKGFILEERGPDTTESGKEQRVPIGTYNLEWHSGTKIKKGLKLFNDVVSKDRAILIHSGNTADDTEGCLLPGTTRSTDFVGGSKDKLKEIFTYVEEIGIKNAKIIITQAYE